MTEFRKVLEYFLQSRKAVLSFSSKIKIYTESERVQHKNRMMHYTLMEPAQQSEPNGNKYKRLTWVNAMEPESLSINMAKYR